VATAAPRPTAAPVVVAGVSGLDVGLAVGAAVAAVVAVGTTVWMWQILGW
jgi:hypothetical protein